MHAVDYNEKCTSTLLDAFAAYLIELDVADVIPQVHQFKLKSQGVWLELIFCFIIARYSVTTLERLQDHRRARTPGQTQLKILVRPANSLCIPPRRGLIKFPRLEWAHLR